MGEILSKKAGEKGVIYKIKTPIPEAIQLKNHMKKIHLFCLDNCKKNTKIVERGSNGGAKYFQIPLELKTRKKNKFSEINYQKLECKNEICYILVANKN